MTTITSDMSLVMGDAIAEGRYWGTTTYRIEWSTRLSAAVAYATSAASSSRRSRRLAVQDTGESAEVGGGMVIESIGRLGVGDLEMLAAWFAAREVASCR